VVKQLGLKKFIFVSVFLSLFLINVNLVFAQESLNKDFLSQKVLTELNFIEDDLIFLKELPDFNAFINGDLSRKEHLQDTFFSFSKNKQIYYQVRYIDESGKEIIRVDNIEGETEIISEDNLQNKKGRYYFDDAFLLDDGDIFVSPLDLNIEQGKLENRGSEGNPVYVPVIRYATPVFDSEKKKVGIIILNVYADYILDIFKKNGAGLSEDRGYLVNKEGYFLFHSDSSKEFGFMFENDITLRNEFGGEFSRVFDSDEGEFNFNGKTYDYIKIFPSDLEIISSSGSPKSYAPSLSKVQGKDYFWILIVESPIVKGVVDFMAPVFLGIYIFLGILIFLGIYFIFFKKKKEKEKEKEKDISGFFFSKLNRKIILGFLIVALLFGVIAGAGSFYLEKAAKSDYINAINEIEADFNDFREGDIRTLSVGLEIAVQDKDLKEVYLEKDRDKLYNYGQNLFNELKDKYAVTHFYFIEPDGNCFVRLHNKDKFNDEIKRATFLKSKETKDIGAGIELGKTAFALRVVKPYYNDNELIGYMELGEEIDHFLEEMKKGKNNEFSIIIDKEFIDEENWASVREVKGLENNWDKLENHVAIESTIENNVHCFNSDNVVKVLDGERVFGTFDSEKGDFVCGGFPLIDASGNEVGAMFALIDSSKKIGFITAIKYGLLFMVVLFILAIIILSFFIKLKIINPIAKLNNATSEIQKRNFKARVDINTGDELQVLGESFNKTAKVLQHMDEEHKQLEKAKTEFLSITSHELRSPMTPMQAQLQMLLGEYYGKLNPKQKNSLDIVARNTKRLDNIIVDFLEISRIEAARLKFRFVKKDLTGSIKRLMKEMVGFMPEKKVKLYSKIGKLPVIEVDPDRVMQVLRNLINNAIKFSPEGKKVVVSAGLKGNMIEFSVKDEGIGIKAEDQKRIFEPFFQAEQTMYREHQGTGLGLAIIRGIVESQEGNVWLESEEGKGTTFFFTIPLKPVRNVKAIKLLFSESKNIEKEIKKVFLDVLGPMGSQEFENLEKRNQLDKKNLIWYSDFLIKKGILSEEKGKLFKDKLLFILGEKKRGIGTNELVKKGLISSPKKKLVAEDILKKESKLNINKKEVRK